VSMASYDLECPSVMTNDSCRDDHVPEATEAKAEDASGEESCLCVLGNILLTAIYGEYLESADMVLGEITRFTCFVPGTFASLPGTQQRHSPFLQWNPLWWTAVLSMMVAIVPGKLFHALFSQDRPLRQDELPLERRARIAWVYTFSGGMVCMLLCALLELIGGLHQGCIGLVRASAVAMLLSVWYLLENAHLLHRMRCRQTVLVRGLIVNRIVFGLAILLVFVLYVVRHDMPSSGDIKYTWTMSVLFGLGMMLALPGYVPLLRHDYADDVRAAQDEEMGMAVCCCHDPLRSTSSKRQLMIAVALALDPIALVFAAFASGGPLLWKVLSGA